jgi:hypothetical protein
VKKTTIDQKILGKAEDFLFRDMESAGQPLHRALQKLYE